MVKANEPLQVMCVLIAVVIGHGRANRNDLGYPVLLNFVHGTTPCPGLYFSVSSCVHFVSDWIISFSGLYL